MSTCNCVGRSVYPSVCLSIHPSTCHCVDRFIRWFVYNVGTVLHVTLSVRHMTSYYGVSGLTSGLRFVSVNFGVNFFVWTFGLLST